MCIPVLKEGWCGCSVKTVAKILSWLQVIFSAFVVLLYLLVEFVFVAIASSDECNGDYECINDMAKIVDNIIKELFGTLAIFVGAYLVILALLFIFGILNLLGIYMEKPYLMVPYLTVSLISTVFDIIVLIFRLKNDGITLSLMFSIIGIGLGIYFLLIVYSYFRELINNGNGRVLEVVV